MISEHVLGGVNMRTIAIVTLLLVSGSTALAQDAAANQMKVDSINDRMRGKSLPIVDGTAKPGGRIVNIADVVKKTNELNMVLHSVNGDVSGLQKGVLAADLTEKLKKIEKLAKDIRHSLA
jgi:hypothetical protein